MSVNKIEVRNVFKVFGNREKDVLAMIRAGKSKEQVLAETDPPPEFLRSTLRSAEQRRRFG